MLLVLCAVILCLLFLYYLGIHNHDFYSKRNIPYVRPLPFIGNLAPMLFNVMSPSDHVMWLYTRLKGERFGGFFGFSTPALLIRDPELIKEICVIHFHHFVDRRILLTEEVDPIAGKVLPSLPGDRWRCMRAWMSPAFTPKKLKEMYPSMLEHAQCLVQGLQGEMEMGDVMSRVCTDILASATLGIQCDSELYEMGQRVTDFQGRGALKLLGYLACPRLMTLLNIRLVDAKAMQFFSSLVLDLKKKEHDRTRQTLLSLLMEQQEANPDNPDLSDVGIAAQVMLVFLAGIETLTTVLCFATYLLATHPHVQTKLRKEIQETTEMTSYGQLHNLKYLDMVISEALRLYPPVDVIDRKCVKPFPIPSTGIVLQEGEGVVVPIYAIHRDPSHFPNPEEFCPERFGSDDIKPFTYLPFGAGPRNCLGIMLGKTIAKLVLLELVQNFQLGVVSRTPVPIRLLKTSFNKRAKGGFWLDLRRLDST